MAFQRPNTMTLSPMFLFCLVAVINNLVMITSGARELKNSLDHHEKEVNNIGGEKGKGDNQADDPSKNNNMPNTQLDNKNQIPSFNFPFPFPFPYPYSPLVPGIPGLPMQTPFPNPFGIPGVSPLPIPSYPFPPYPPVGIPGLGPSLRVPSPSAP